jgi:hypothetical protein
VTTGATDAGEEDHGMTSEHHEQHEQVGALPARRTVLKGMAALGLGSLSARGIYGILEDVVRPTPASAAAPTVVRRLQEQYLVERIEVVVDNGITLAIPPIYNDVFTAKLKNSVNWTTAALKAAKARVENALLTVEKPYTATAAGLTMVIGWGLPYFRTFTPGLMNAYLPAIPGTNPKQYAVLDAIRFPSDPDTGDPHPVVLEDNHVMFKFRSDSQSIVQGAESALFENPNSGAYIGDLFDLTSKRIGFLGRGFNQPSAAKRLALAANIPGADKIPDRSQLMMGFTSTQTNALAPDNLPSFETLRGVTDQWPGGYFAAGCAMHLSHLYLDLASWYGQPYDSRVKHMFSPHTTVPASASTVTISNGPGDVATMSQVTSEAADRKAGHNSLLQQATRLGADVLDNYGRLRKKGTAVPLREDFNTIDDPFAWSPASGTTTTYSAGMHFVAFVPGHHLFHRARLAMDGQMPNGTNLGLTPDETGINGIMRASHRQNYVIPPRKNRSFPLVELLK